ncbi:hypothetical protein [Micromonospora rubida]
MPRALKTCSTPGCPELVRTGRCPTCQANAEARRGTARQRGYDRQHETRFRAKVLRRNPLCVCETTGHHHGAQCLRPSSVADHHPLSRRELVDAGLDPNDPRHGRGLCEGCHNRHTSEAQPGGWNAR